MNADAAAVAEYVPAIGDAVQVASIRSGKSVSWSNKVWYVVRISETSRGTRYHVSGTPGKGRGGLGTMAEHLRLAV